MQPHRCTGLPSCFGCKVKSIQLSAGTPALAAEKAMGRDIDAYRALRADGTQPRSVHGSHRLEATATTVAEIEQRPDVERIMERVME